MSVWILTHPQEITYLIAAIPIFAGGFFCGKFHEIKGEIKWMREHQPQPATEGR